MRFDSSNLFISRRSPASLPTGFCPFKVLGRFQTPTYVLIYFFSGRSILAFASLFNSLIMAQVKYIGELAVVALKAVRKKKRVPRRPGYRLTCWTLL